MSEGVLGGMSLLVLSVAALATTLPCISLSLADRAAGRV